MSTRRVLPVLRGLLNAGRRRCKDILPKAAMVISVAQGPRKVFEVDGMIQPGARNLETFLRLHHHHQCPPMSTRSRPRSNLRPSFVLPPPLFLPRSDNMPHETRSATAANSPILNFTPTGVNRARKSRPFLSSSRMTTPIKRASRFTR